MNFSRMVLSGRIFLKRAAGIRSFFLSIPQLHYKDVGRPYVRLRDGVVLFGADVSMCASRRAFASVSKIRASAPFSVSSADTYVTYVLGYHSRCKNQNLKF